MSALPRPLALIAGLAAWSVATFWTDLGLAHPGRRWILFVSGTVFLLLFTTARKDERDPGPFERGFDPGERSEQPSFGAVFGLTLAALALRLVTLGRPAFVDQATLGTLWQMATGDGTLLARLPFAICGALSPALLYFATRRGLGEAAAILGAAVLAFAPAHVILSQALDAGALSLFLFLAATLALQSAIAHDRGFVWWVYGFTTLAAILLGPWSLAILIGQALILLGWGVGRTLTGYPTPLLRSFLSMMAIVATVQAFVLAVLAATPAGAGNAPATTVSWLWIPTGIDGGMIPIAVWLAAGIGLVRLLGKNKLLGLLLVLTPALLAPVIQWIVRPGLPFAVIPWPVLPGLAIAAGLGLQAIVQAIQFLAKSAFPGRIEERAWRPVAILIAGALIALTITPGLRRHYNRAPANRATSALPAALPSDQPVTPAVTGR